jgi:Rad3-related DNA helicase
MGEELHACPYYASREAVGFAQLVCAPYNIILQADMRHSMGLRLKGPLLCFYIGITAVNLIHHLKLVFFVGNVLIFDEAHNLIDTVS